MSPQYQSIRETDVVIVGAGPVGLFAVFELGLLGLRAELVDTLDKPGGQCAELYPEKPIYDIPAWPIISGQDLTDRLMEQAAPFEPGFHLGQRVERLLRDCDGKFIVETSNGHRLKAPVVFVAAGAGSFTPRRPKLDDLAAFEATGAVQYAVRHRADFVGRDVMIAGGGDSAID
ncbi:MAG: NAD(P)/FAD-dependent oxidoreductase, partial [Proteobacteria bacterium]|nr:NAD(P)/FAD-dependent oxidoreductase [Pseudomonadota bacterium]